METPLGLESLLVQAWSATAVLALSDMRVYLSRPLSVPASGPFHMFLSGICWELDEGLLLKLNDSVSPTPFLDALSLM